MGIYDGKIRMSSESTLPSLQRISWSRGFNRSINNASIGVPVNGDSMAEKYVQFYWELLLKIVLENIQENEEEEELVLRELCRGVKRLNSARDENAGVDHHVGSRYEVGTSQQQHASGEDSSDNTGQHVGIEGGREQSKFAGAGVVCKEQEFHRNGDSGLPPGWTNVYYIDANRLLGDLHWEREHRQENSSRE
jgi:hypothetical protein